MSRPPVWQYRRSFFDQRCIKMRFMIIEPTAAVFNGSQEDLDRLKAFLTFTNTSVSYLISKHMKNKWFKQSRPREWAERLNELKAQAKKTLVFEKNGLTFIRPGSLSYLKDNGFEFEVENHIEYPKPQNIVWKTPLPFDPYPYQTDAVKALVEAKHGGIDVATGLGKSLIAALLTKHFGLKTLIVVPSKSIFLELFNFIETHFGKGKVGAFGNGKKDISKQITVAISKSLTLIEEDSPEWEFFQQKQVLIIDEAHTFGSAELDDVCHGVTKNIPYRFFMSGTQTRGDGGIKLLQSITGPIVYGISTKSGIEGGYLSPIETRIISVNSPSSKKSKDPGKMKREHFLYNQNIINKAAQIANVLGNKGESTLILVEEIEQISMLLKKLTVPACYMHGNTTKKEELARLGLEKTDLKTTLLDFNMGKFKVLIGTPAIEVGTNIFCHNGINLQGGASEINVKQGIIGRMVRRLDKSRYAKYHPPKSVARLFDFDVEEIEMLHRHLQTRIKFYEATGGKVFYIKTP